MIRTFELTLAKDYSKKWGLQEALRELVQNAIDFANEAEDNTMSISYDEESSTLSIANKDSILTKKTLLLGYTSKEDNPNAIGQFGEGYKIALLVLNRLNKNVTIYNYGRKEVWTTKFVKSKKYEGELVLKISIDTEPIWKKVPNNNLTFEIQDVSKEDYEELVDRTLQLQGEINSKSTSDMGRILTDKKYKGKVFVNGLWIKNIPSLEYGYDITPSYLNIGRDRDLVSEYDISYTTSGMWALNQGEELLKLINKNALDVRNINGALSYNYRLYNKVEKKDLCNYVYDGFKEKYGDKAIPSTTQEERNVLEKSYPEADIITVKDVEKELIVSSPNYKEMIDSIEISEEISITELYSQWREENSYVLNSNALKDLDDIINLAKERLGE